MKFEKLRKPLPQCVKPTRKYWTKARCILLVENYDKLEEMELRKMFGGLSMSRLRAKLTELRKNGWNI